MITLGTGFERLEAPDFGALAPHCALEMIFKPSEKTIKIRS